jgi:hypothetical protein
MAITDTQPLAKITGVTPSYEQYIEPTQKTMQESGKAKAELAGLQQSMESKRTEQKVKDVGAVEEQYATKVATAPEMAEKRRVSESMEKPFIPTQENAKDMASLFSLINVVGFALGAGGKRNAQAAMSAMNGMLEGHRAGREDVYKKEKTAFDTSLKQLKMRYDTLDNQLKDALNTYKIDKEAGLRKAEMAYAEAGANFYKQYQDKFGLAAMYEFHKQAYESAKKMYTELKREENRAISLNQAADREKRAERREDRADARLAASLAAKAGGGIVSKPEKTPSDVEKSVRQNALFLSNIEGIVSEADKLIKEGNIRGIGVIQGKIPYDVAQLYMTKAERDFLQDFNALTNQKLKDQSGATVTGAEFARQRGVLPLRDDDPKVILDKLKNWERLIAQETSVYGRAYPGVIRKYGITLDMPSDKSKLVPGLEYKTPRGTMLWDGSNFLEPSGE